MSRNKSVNCLEKASSTMELMPYLSQHIEKLMHDKMQYGKPCLPRLDDHASSQGQYWLEVARDLRVGIAILLENITHKLQGCNRNFSFNLKRILREEPANLHRYVLEP